MTVSIAPANNNRRRPSDRISTHSAGFGDSPWRCMKMLFVADLHYTFKQFDWVMANATKYDPIIIGVALLDLSSALDPDIQIAVLAKYLYRLIQHPRLVACSH